MEKNEALKLAIEEAFVVPPTEASLRLQVTDLLLGSVRKVRMGRIPLEQGDVMPRIEAALETYGSFFYPPEHR
ncbi:MAG TPA: hypothetical protein VFY59_07045 [Rubrobacter sp.]|nr:hypothetical protein [Rubrobacter sp.]